MSIRLTWKNTNSVQVTVRIYRGDTELDRANLPTPIATLIAGETQYVDQTAVQGNTYFYVFETIGAKDRVVSRNYQLQAVQSRGPGSNILKFGDRGLGFYDTIPADSLINAASLITLSGISGMTASTFATWVKYARNGKVLYVPNSTVATNVSFDQLNTAGLVDGTKTVTIQGSTFKVRLLTGCPDTLDIATIGVDDNMDTLGGLCEFNDLVYPLVDITPLGQRLPNLINQTATVTGMAPPVRGALTASATDQKAVIRGSIAATRQRFTAINTIGISEKLTTVAWWPVLELVEV